MTEQYEIAVKCDGCTDGYNGGVFHEKCQGSGVVLISNEIQPRWHRVAAYIILFGAVILAMYFAWFR